MVGQQKQAAHDGAGWEEAPITIACTPLDAAIIPPRCQGYDDWRLALRACVLEKSVTSTGEGLGDQITWTT
jgi:hypothetical protein